MIVITKKNSLQNSQVSNIDFELSYSVLFSSETLIKAQRKGSIDTDVTADLTFNSSSSKEDIYDKTMQWFSAKGIKQGNPQELNSSVGMSRRKQLSQLKIKTISAGEKTVGVNKRKMNLCVSI